MSVLSQNTIHHSPYCTSHLSSCNIWSSYYWMKHTLTLPIMPATLKCTLRWTHWLLCQYSVVQQPKLCCCIFILCNGPPPHHFEIENPLLEPHQAWCHLKHHLNIAIVRAAAHLFSEMYPPHRDTHTILLVCVSAWLSYYRRWETLRAIDTQYA